MDRPLSINGWIQTHFSVIRVATFFFCSLPALWLGWQWKNDTLGINPLAEILDRSGYWSLLLLLITLSLAPLRRASRKIAALLQLHYGRRMPDWNWLIRLRRQLGLFSFSYAALHFTFYFQFEVGFDWELLWEDLIDRPLILSGLAALLTFVPLAVTSNFYSIRSLGRRWRLLHNLVYVIALLVLHHVWAQSKIGDFSLLPYCLTLLGLLAYKCWSSQPIDLALGLVATSRQQETPPFSAKKAESLVDKNTQSTSPI